MTERTAFKGWCILELMGHRRLAGLVQDAELAGGAFIRIDIPSTPPATQFYAPGAVYCITPTTEEIARAVAAKARPEPVAEWELRGLLASSPAPEDTDDQDDPMCAVCHEVVPDGGKCACERAEDAAEAEAQAANDRAAAGMPPQALPRCPVHETTDGDAVTNWQCLLEEGHPGDHQYDPARLPLEVPF